MTHHSTHPPLVPWGWSQVRADLYTRAARKLYKPMKSVCCTDTHKNNEFHASRDCHGQRHEVEFFRSVHCGRRALGPLGLAVAVPAKLAAPAHITDLIRPFSHLDHCQLSGFFFPGPNSILMRCTGSATPRDFSIPSLLPQHSSQLVAAPERFSRLASSLSRR